MGRPVKPLITPGNALASALAGLLLGAVRALPEGARQRVARVVGWLAFTLGLRRRVALDNLAHAFPEKTVAERRAIAAGAYQSLALAALESLTSDRLTEAE